MSVPFFLFGKQKASSLKKSGDLFQAQKLYDTDKELISDWKEQIFR